MDNQRQWRDVGLGALAGLVGTLAVQAVRSASQKWAPSTMPPMREEPGKFMTRQAESLLPSQTASKIPKGVETALGSSLGLGYGMTFGALYATMRPRDADPITCGVALGLATWAIGYLGWLPATGLLPPPWQQEPLQVAAPAVRHALYGVVTAATFEGLENLTTGCCE